MNVRYLTSLPEDVRIKEKKLGLIQIQLDEFMKTNSPIMEISVDPHYKNIETARTTWWRAIKKSGYPLRTCIPKDKRALYVVKVDPDRSK